jgi:flagellar hook-basal body complex protein FliE
MNPLSAMNLGNLPAFRPDLQLQAGQGVAGRAIPAAELGRLMPQGEATAAPSIAVGGDSFSNLLGQIVRDVSDRQAAAGEAVTGLVSGQNVSLHQAMIAVEEASVSFQLMVEVRNRLLESYQELMRMQV